MVCDIMHKYHQHLEADGVNDAHNKWLDLSLHIRTNTHDDGAEETVK